MSKLKKLMAITLALVMALALAVPALAEETYSITIKNSDNATVSIIGKTFSAYKVFDLTLGGETPTYTQATVYDNSAQYYTKDGNTYTAATVADESAFNSGTYYIKGNNEYSAYAYSIKNNDWAWNTLIEGATTATNGEITTTYGIILRPSATDSTVYIVDVGTMTDENARHLADALKAVLPQTANGKVENATAEDVTITLSVPGYYAVYGTAKPKSDASQEVVAAVALTTTNPTAVVVPKVEVPTLEKRIIAETVLDNKNETASIRPGSEVTFELISTVPDLRGYSNYTFKISDTMSSGLSFIGPDTTNSITDLSVAITRGSSRITLQKEQYDIVHTVGTNSFDLIIPYETLKEFTQDAPIHVTYPAIVNSSSLNTNYEKNSATLTYSKDPYSSFTTTNTTPSENVYIFNVDVDVEKVDSKNTSTKLAGAEFKLYRKTSLPADNEEEWYKWDQATGAVIYTTKENADTFTTDENGNLITKIQGLPVTQTGVAYGLVETKAPAGYNLLSEPVAFSLKGVYDDSNKRITIQYKPADGQWTNVSLDATINVTQPATAHQPTQTIQVKNGTSSMLPSTGGAGLYIVAGVAIVALLGFGGTAMLKRKVNGED